MTDPVVWIALRNGSGEAPVYHVTATCYRGGKPTRWPRIPTFLSYLRAAGAVPCSACGAVEAVAA